MCLFLLIGCGYDEMEDIEAGMFYKQPTLQGQDGKDMIPDKKKPPTFKFLIDTEEETESEEGKENESESAEEGQENQQTIGGFKFGGN